MLPAGHLLGTGGLGPLLFDLASLRDELVDRGASTLHRVIARSVAGLDGASLADRRRQPGIVESRSSGVEFTSLQVHHHVESAAAGPRLPRRLLVTRRRVA